MNKKNIDHDIYAGIAILLACVAFLIASLDINNSNNAALFPWMLIAAMAAMGIWIMLNGFKRMRAGNPQQRVSAKSLKIPAACYLYAAAYLALYYLFGYMIASAVFLVAYMRYLKVCSRKTVILVTIGYLIGVYIVFYLIFHVQIISFGRIGRLLQGV